MELLGAEVPLPLVQVVLLKMIAIGRFFKMKYIVGTNQKTKLYTAKFSSSSGFLLCKNNTHNTVNGIAVHNTKPVASGIYGHKALFVAVLWNISSLYSTLLALDIRYGEKIRVASSRKIPPGIKSIASCAINIGIEGSVKNIKFQKLSLFNLALIKLCIIASGVIGIYYSYVNEKSFKKLCFFRDCTKRGKDTIKYLDNKSQRLNEAEENLEYAISNYIDNYPSPLKATLRNFFINQTDKL